MQDELKVVPVVGLGRSERPFPEKHYLYTTTPPPEACRLKTYECQHDQAFYLFVKYSMVALPTPQCRLILIIKSYCGISNATMRRFVPATSVKGHESG